jgi:hypothetical protein
MINPLRVTIALNLLVFSAYAHEYPLQFIPASGARGLVVAGYQISGATVTGTCSYYIVTSGSGKGGGYHSTTTYFNQTCAWDLTGNLLTVKAGAPATPPVLFTIGTRTAYSTNGSSTTGTDSALIPNHGYIDTPSPHYIWGSFTAPIGPGAQKLTLTLASDGDMSLDVTAVTESTSLARSQMTSTNCIGVVTAGSSCSISVYYDPTRLAYPTGLIYDTLTVTLQSNAPQAGTFSSHFTIRVRVGDND